MDENGTLDLSMKKVRILDKAAPLTSTNPSVPTASSSPFKTSSLLVNAAFYQALCDHEGWDTPINYSKAHGCPTLCDPTDGSPPGSPVPGIL